MSITRLDRTNAKITLANYEFVFSQSDRDMCYRLTNQHIALLSAHIEMMAWKTRWHKNEKDVSKIEHRAIVEFVDDLTYRLFSPFNCGDSGTVVPVTNEGGENRSLGYVRALEGRIAELGEEIENMASKCCELRWSKDGRLQMRVDTACGCEWIDIPYEGGLLPNPASGTLGANVGASMINSDGTPKLVSIPLEKSSANASAIELRACSKATALVRMFRNVLETATMAEIREALDEIPFPTTTVITGITAKLLPEFLPVVGAFKLMSIAADITDPIVEEINERLNQKTEAEAICTLYPLISKSYELTGEDITNAILSLGFKAGDISFLVVNALTQAMDVRAIKEHLELKFSDTDCGCPDIVAKQTGSSTNPPELADFRAVADFKLQHPSYYGFTIDYGVYEQGVGVKESIDPAKTRAFAFIYKGLTPNVMIERVDVYLENVIKGEFWSDPQGADYDLEGYYMRSQFNSSPLSVRPIKTPVTQATLGFKPDQLKLQFMFGYDEREPNIIPDQSGRGTIVKVVVWGRGTPNTDYNGWAVDSV